MIPKIPKLIYLKLMVQILIMIQQPIQMADQGLTGRYQMMNWGVVLG